MLPPVLRHGVGHPFGISSYRGRGHLKSEWETSTGRAAQNTPGWRPGWTTIVNGHSIDRFGVVKGITWPSVETRIKENQWNINENNEKSTKTIGFHCFSLILFDFSLLFISALGHVSTCGHFSHSKSIDRVAVNDCCSSRASLQSVLNHSESSAVAQGAW